MSQDLNLRLRITGDGSGLKGELRTASGEVVKFGDTLEGGAKRGTRALKETEQQTSKLGSVTGTLVKSIAATAAAYLSVRGASRLLQTVTEQTLRQEAAWIQLEARIRSTGGAAGKTLSDLKQLSAGLQGVTTFANEDVEEMLGVLLTFANIAGPQFDRTAESILNVSTAMGQDLKSAALQVGKALNDPISGMDGLNRSGIQFSDSQKEAIKRLAETGDMAGAQTLILNELEMQFGGAARAARDSFGGALKALRNDWEDLLKFTGEMPELAGQIELISARLRDPDLRAAVEDGILAVLQLIPPTINAGVSALETIVPVLTTVADNSNKIRITVELLSTVIATRLVVALGAAAKAKVLNIALANQLAAGWTRASIASTALATGARAAAGAFTLMGGPIGVAALALGAAIVAQRQYQDRLAELRPLASDVADAVERMQTATRGEWSDQQPRQYRQALSEVNAEIDRLESKLAAAATAIEAAGRGPTQTAVLDVDFRMVEIWKEQVAALREVRDEEEAVANARADIAARFGSEADRYALGAEKIAQVSDVAIGFLERMGLTIQSTGSEVEGISDQITDLLEPLDEYAAKLEQELFVLEAVAGGRQSAAMATLEFQQAQAMAQATSEADRQAIEEKYDALRALTGDIDRARAAQEQNTQAELDARTASQAQAQQIQTLAGSYRQLLAAANPLAAQQLELQEQMAGMQQLAGLSAAELSDLGVSAELLEQVISGLSREMAQLDGGVDLFPVGDGKDFLDLIDDAIEKMQELADIEWNLEGFLDSFHPLAGEMRRLGDEIKLIDKALAKGLISNAEAGFMKVGASASAAFGAMMAGVDQTSKEYKALEIAQQATNVALGIAAILQQGMGDPYTAVPRMIAMAAMVAQLVGNISGFSGGGGGAQERQANQGTGTVLGVPDAKSDSIAEAAKLTVDVLKTLVGINRGMLMALESMNEAITGASTAIAGGGIGEVDVPTINRSVGQFGPGLGFKIDDFLGGLFGFNKTKIKDSGIELFGGTLAEVIEQGIGQAFVRVKRKGLFGSKNKTGFGDLTDEVSTQLELLLESMVDAVSAGAEALGLSAGEIEAAINAFQIEAQKISLKDLSAEEQQAELEAVFSSIFDGLAGEIVPFIRQFQEVGEGLGATLIRVATGVQVTQEAMRRLGFALDETDPEKFAQASEGLISLIGGIDEFIAGMTGFVDKFAPESVKAQVAFDDITRGLEQANLKLPATRDGFWDLMNSLDATTEAGQEQIATLLRLRDAADTYYSTIEEIQDEREGLERRLLQLQGDTAALRALELAGLDESNRALQLRIWALEDEQAAIAELTRLTAAIEDDIARLTMTPLRKEFRDLTLSFRETMSAMEELGASEDQFAAARQRHALQLQQLAASLIANIQSQVAEFRELLGVGDTGSSSQSSPWSGGGNQPVIDAAVENFRDAIIRALESIEDWLNDSELNNPSLTKRQRFNRTQDEFDRLVEQALTGTPEEQAEAAAALPQLASELRDLGVQMFGSATQPFGDLMDRIEAGLESVLGIDVPDAEVDVGVTSAQGSAIQTSTETTADNTYRLVEISAQVIEGLGLLSQITSQSAIDLAQQHNVPLRQMIEQLIGTVDAGDVGVVDQLIAVANTLGEDLVDVADVIGLEVGTLRDSSSILSQALQDTILQMPEEIRGQLLEPLDRLWEATTDADATTALDDLLRISADLPAEQRNALAPFFAQIDPIDYLISQTNLLYTISGLQADIAASAAGAIGAIGSVEGAVHGTTAAISGIAAALMGVAEAIQGMAADENPAQTGGTLPPPDLPGMALGGWVNSDSVIRAGEAGRELILPNPVSEFFAREGIPVRMPSAAGGAESAAELRRIAELLAEGNRDRNVGVQRLETAQVAVATSMDEVAREARSMAGMQR